VVGASSMLVLMWWLSCRQRCLPLVGEEGDGGGTARAPMWIALLWATRTEKAVWPMSWFSVLELGSPC
jgi:hypothetical protein